MPAEVGIGPCSVSVAVQENFFGPEATSTTRILQNVTRAESLDSILANANISLGLEWIDRQHWTFTLLSLLCRKVYIHLGEE